MFRALKLKTILYKFYYFKEKRRKKKKYYKKKKEKEKELRASPSLASSHIPRFPPLTFQGFPAFRPGHLCLLGQVPLVQPFPARLLVYSQGRTTASRGERSCSPRELLLMPALVPAIWAKGRTLCCNLCTSLAACMFLVSL